MPPFNAIQPLFCTNSLCLAHYASKDVADAGLCLDCGSHLADRTLGESQALPKDTQIWKKLYTLADEENYFASLVLGSGDKDSIHRPEICLVAQGFMIIDERVEQNAMPDGHSLKVKLLQIVAPNAPKTAGAPPSSLYAYWFFQSDRETPHHTQRVRISVLDGIVRNTWTPWAYITIHATGVQNVDAHVDRLKAFIQKLYPPLQEYVGSDPERVP